MWHDIAIYTLSSITDAVLVFAITHIRISFQIIDQISLLRSIKNKKFLIVGQVVYSLEGISLPIFIVIHLSLK